MEDKKEWVINGMDWDEPLRVRSAEELIRWVEEVGFLPLFEGDIPGFSAENHTWYMGWWSGDPEQDPWIWREEIARSGRVAYGKFFRGKAGFISKEWFPVFANARRDGYDFDARWEDGLVNIRNKKIMDLFETHDEMLSPEIKAAAGFGKDGLKNFEGVMSELQRQGYLIVKDFRRRKNKKGQEYGWNIAVYTTPEKMWGDGIMAQAYKEKPEESAARIREKVKSSFPYADEKLIRKMLG